MAVVAREEEVAARRGNLVPDHHARAEVLEARGDLEGMVAEERGTRTTRTASGARGFAG